MIFAVTVFLILILIIFGYCLSNIVIKPRTHSVEETLKNEIEAGKIKKDEFDKLQKEEVYIKSRYGYILKGLYFPNGDSKKTVVICHGITWTLYGSVKYMDLFKNRGWNILIYDHRNHGQSGGKNTTFGLFEKYDLKSVVDWVLLKNGPGAVVGTMGESLGAATVLQHTEIDKRIAFCIADCPYSDLTRLLTYRLKVQSGMPYFPIIPLASFACWVRCGMSFKKVSPIKAIRKVKIPIFFIHGKDDRYIPPQMSIEMYEIKKGPKKLYLAPNARHAEAFWNNRKEYDKKIGEFLEMVGI